MLTNFAEQQTDKTNKLSRDIGLIEQTAQEAVGGLYPFILKNVTEISRMNIWEYHVDDAPVLFYAKKIFLFTGPEERVIVRICLVIRTTMESYYNLCIKGSHKGRTFTVRYKCGRNVCSFHSHHPIICIIFAKRNTSFVNSV